MALVSPHNLNVPACDPTVSVQVVAEVGARHGLVELVLNRSLIGSTYGPVGIRITSEETKTNISVWHAIAVDILHPQNDCLSSSDTGELRCHAVTVEANRSDRGGATK